MAIAPVNKQSTTQKYTKKLAGRRVLLIGGTSGIGFCIAEACLEFGAHVTVASSGEAKVKKAIERLTTSYPGTEDRVAGTTCDLGGDDQEANLHRLFKFATDDGAHKLDHVVNTAGDRFERVPLLDTTSSDIQKLGHIRFQGSIFIGKIAPQYMNKATRSSITFTGGMNATKPGPGWAVKAGLAAANEGMTRALAVDLSPIRVNLVAPGVIDTEFLGSLFGEEKRQAQVDQYGTMTLLGKIGKPEDVAEAYLYTMKDSFVTGRTMLSDGGYALT